MLKIGLTGGIGSGKSTVAEIFTKLGAAVIDADEIAHHLTRTDNETLTLITAAFGEEYLTSTGELDRKKLATYVFNDNQAHQKLESIIHPRVRAAMSESLTTLKSPYAVLVIPLLFETEFNDLIDRVLVVDTTKKIQIDRVQKRDNRSMSEIEAIMKHQIDRESRLERADDVLQNTTTIDSLENAVKVLHEKYLQLASENKQD